MEPDGTIETWRCKCGVVVKVLAHTGDAEDATGEMRRRQMCTDCLRQVRLKEIREKMVNRP